MTFRCTFTLRLAAALLLACGLAAAQDADGPTPRQKSKPRPSAARVRKPKPGAEALPLAKRMDLNSASKAQLATLPGITEAIADKIIAGRPYQVSTELVTKNILTTTSYLSIRKLVTSVPPRK